MIQLKKTMMKSTLESNEVTRNSRAVQNKDQNAADVNQSKSTSCSKTIIATNFQPKQNAQRRMLEVQF